MSTSKKDNNFKGARNLGSLGGSKGVNGFVGRKDKLDFARFSLSGASDFGLTLGGVKTSKGKPKSAVRVTLRNGDGAIFQSFRSGSKPRSFGTQLAAGTYYIGVQQLKGEVRYKLRTSATPAIVIPPSPITPIPPINQTPAPDTNTLATAFDIGLLTGTYIKQDVVGGTDPVDFYKFTLNDIANLQVRINDGARIAGVKFIRDDNGNGLVDTGEVFASRLLPLDMPPGTYFIQVDGFSNLSSPYELTLVPTFFGGNVSPEPGNTLPIASNILGVLSGTRVIKEYVGILDDTDIYRFTLNDLSKLQITFAGTSRDPEVQLIRDSNNNGLIDTGEIFITGNDFGILSDSTTTDLPTGTYFLLVKPEINSSFSTSYRLDLVTTPYGGNGLPDPGNTKPAARDLGVLSGTSSLKEYVGVLDPDDFYRFTLSNPANLQVGATASSNVALDLDLIKDINNNGLVDNNEILISRATSNSGIGSLASNLQAGTYFLRVKSRSSFNFPTNYELSWTV